MSLNIKFSPICGTGPDDPVCGLLELDGARLLLDCGCSTPLNETQLAAIARVVTDVDAVLLTHGMLSHIGALPVLVARGALPAQVPIVSTMPVKTLGSLMLLEHLNDMRACSDFEGYTAAHVTELCEQRPWLLARFYQRIDLSGRAAGVSVTPHAAGHTLGGAVWKLAARDGQEVVYCTEWNHRKERHLAACQLPDLYDRPAALLLSARCSLAPELKIKLRDAEFFDVLLSTLRGTDGCVLVPVDTTTRLLELALLLDEFWAREKFDRVYPLVLVSSVGRAVAEAAQSMLEFMADSVGKAFELHRNNPFNFKCIKVVSNLSQLSQLQAGPKVVLAGSANLEYGPARQLLLDWAPEEKNTICFVQRPQTGTLAHTLLTHPFPETDADSFSVSVQHTKRVPLEGAELEAWLAGQQPGAEEPGQDAAKSDSAMETDKAAEPGAAASDAGVGALGPPGAPSSGGAGTSGATPFGSLSRRSSIVSGSTALRSSSIQLSTLVRGPTGQLEQQLQQQQQPQQLQQPVSATAPYTTVLSDGIQRPPEAQHAMFQDEDDGVLEQHWDEYGIKIDHARFKSAMLVVPLGSSWRSKTSKRKDLGIKQEEDEDVKSDTKDPAMGDAEMSEESESEDDRPTKLVTETIDLLVRAAVRYFDFDGMPDGRIFQKALVEVCPHSLVVLRGAPEERRELQALAERDLVAFHTHTVLPGAGELVDVSVPLCHRLYVSEAMYRLFPLHPLGTSGSMGAVVEGMVAAADPHFPELLQLVPKATGLSRLPSGALLSSAASMRLEGASTGGPMDLDEGYLVGPQQQGWVGDIFFADGKQGVQLSEVRKALLAAGIQSQLSAGVLSCGPVLISKATVYEQRPGGGTGHAAGSGGDWSGRGHLVVESAVSEQHDELLQKVRHVILKHFGGA